MESSGSPRRIPAALLHAMKIGAPGLIDPVGADRMPIAQARREAMPEPLVQPQIKIAGDFPKTRKRAAFAKIG